MEEVIFDYQRLGEMVIQSDGYQAYDQFEDREGTVLTGCLAHARRYFEYAKDSDPVRAEHALLLIQQLYAVERKAREMNLEPEDRCILRQERSVPVMDALGYLIENSIRPVAPGRKNYLFVGSHSGAEKAAMLYSLPESCKLQNINPYDYLQDVLERLPKQRINRLHELLPPIK